MNNGNAGEISGKGNGTAQKTTHERSEKPPGKPHKDLSNEARVEHRVESEKTRVKTRVERETTWVKPRQESEKTRVEIISLLWENPYTTGPELARVTGISKKGIEWQLKRLKEDGVIKRVGPRKGGHWEVIEDDE